MAWEQRRAQSYYYAKRREGGRVVSVYYGSGELAQAVAEITAAQRRSAMLTRTAEQERRTRDDRGRQIVRDVAGELRTVLAAVLVANGYHQHKRQWRRRMQPLGYGEISPMPPALAPPDPEEVKRGLRALREALDIAAQPARKGTKAAETQEQLAEKERRTAVRQVLKDYPCIWPHLRYKISNGRDALMDVVGCHADTTTGMVMAHAMKAIRNDLGYEYAPMLEQLLIEQVVITWLDFDIVQQHYAGYAIKSHT